MMFPDVELTKLADIVKMMKSSDEGLAMLKNGSTAGTKTIKEVAESGLSETAQSGLKALRGTLSKEGLAQARANNLVGTEAVSFARRYASKWENLKIGGTSSPLGLAAARFFPNIAVQKYHEIGNYPSQIMARVAGTFR